MHKTTPTDVALDQPFRFENFIGGRNGGPVQSKLASQFSRRRKSVTIKQDTGTNLLDNLIG